MKKLIFIGVLVFGGCIGTDYENDPKDSAIIADVESIQLMVTQSIQIEAVYHYNMWRPEPDQKLNWLSLDPTIAEVSENGLVTGLKKGQTNVRVLFPAEDTIYVAVTVIESNNDVAKVIVNGLKTTLSVGENLQLNYEATTINDVIVTGSETIWTSSNENIATVDQAGLVTGIASGITSITATVDGVNSLPYVIMVGATGKVGVFQGSGSYHAQGTATLVSEGGNLTLTFSDDFETSFALGTFVYLANSTSGTTVRSQGLEVAEVTSNGAKSYDISSIDGTITLDTYQYVILLCKPASITFGSAELK